MKMKKSSSVPHPQRDPSIPIDLLGGFFEWMQTEAGQASDEASSAVFAALEKAQVDVKARRILWPDGKALTVEESARRIARQMKMKTSQVVGHVVGWLECGYEPKGLNEKQMGRFEAAIDRWIQECERSIPEDLD